MFSKINHVAIVSENYAHLAEFYQTMFGMTASTIRSDGTVSSQYRQA